MAFAAYCETFGTMANRPAVRPKAVVICLPQWVVMDVTVSSCDAVLVRRALAYCPGAGVLVCWCAALHPAAQQKPGSPGSALACLHNASGHAVRDGLRAQWRSRPRAVVAQSPAPPRVEQWCLKVSAVPFDLLCAVCAMAALTSSSRPACWLVGRQAMFAHLACSLE